jgi:hypothetical protein
VTTWGFLLILHLASFGGDVRATLTTQDETGCWKLRQTILKELGGERNLQGSVSLCTPTQPLKP